MAFEDMPPTPFADVIAGTELEAGELAAIREVLAQKEHALESDTVTPDARLDNLLADRYDSVAAHHWRKHGVSSNAYSKLEEIFRAYVKNGSEERVGNGFVATSDCKTTAVLRRGAERDLAGSLQNFDIASPVERGR